MAKKETDMYVPLRDYLVAQGYSVRSEVLDCDTVAEKDGELLVVEMKRHLSVALLVQGARRQRAIPSVYLAIPHPGKKVGSSDWGGTLHLLRRLELGLILVRCGPDPWVEVVQDPLPYERRRRPKERAAVIREVMGRSGDYNQGGSSRRKVVTAYRESAILLARYLWELGPRSPAELRRLGAPDKTPGILWANHYGWFQRVARGVYSVTPKGVGEASSYGPLWERAKVLLDGALSSVT